MPLTVPIAYQEMKGKHISSSETSVNCKPSILFLFSKQYNTREIIDVIESAETALIGLKVGTIKIICINCAVLEASFG